MYLITLSFQLRYAKNTNKCAKRTKSAKSEIVVAVLQQHLADYCLLVTLICVLSIPYRSGAERQSPTPLLVDGVKYLTVSCTILFIY
jgi:hypothetical protein